MPVAENVIDGIYFPFNPGDFSCESLLSRFLKHLAEAPQQKFQIVVWLAKFGFYQIKCYLL